MMKVTLIGAGNLATQLGKSLHRAGVEICQVFSRTEGTRGELGFYIVSDGTTKPYRIHIRRPSFVNMQGLNAMCRGMFIGDSVAAYSSIDPIMGEVDC